MTNLLIYEFIMGVHGTSNQGLNHLVIEVKQTNSEIKKIRDFR